MKLDALFQNPTALPTAPKVAGRADQQFRQSQRFDGRNRQEAVH
jgi:hypothetical protein